MTSELVTSATPFTDVCTPVRQADGRYTATISPLWTIGPKVHGGTLVAASAAVGLAGLRDSLLESGQQQATDMFPIAAATDFQGAPDPGEVTFDVALRKTGRQISLADVVLRQHDRILVRTALTFGHLDEDIAYQADNLTGGLTGDEPLDEMPVEPPADALYYDTRSADAGVQMGSIVHLARACELRLDAATAAFLRGATDEPRLRLWIKPFDADTLDPDVTAYFAMMAGDVSPPVVFNRGHFGWSPTVQLSTYLRRRPAPGWLRVVASARSIGSRMFDEDHIVIDSAGAVVAQTRQLALIPQQ